MIINSKKSAIVQFGLNTRKPKQDEVEGIPWLTKYTYLGGVIQSNTRTDEHSKRINSKIGWITARLTPFRILNDIRLSANLFKIFLTPLFHQAAANLLFTTELDLIRFEKHYKRSLKKFLCLPYNMSDQILFWIHQPPVQLLSSRVRRIVAKTAVNQMQQVILKEIPLRQQPNPVLVKVFPNNLTKLLRVLYLRSCKQHQKGKGRHHYQTDHGIKINLERMLILYQNSSDKWKQTQYQYYSRRMKFVEQKIQDYQKDILKLTR